jgi:hypothetical protein
MQCMGCSVVMPHSDTAAHLSGGKCESGASAGGVSGALHDVNGRRPLVPRALKALQPAVGGAASPRPSEAGWSTPGPARAADASAAAAAAVSLPRAGKENAGVVGWSTPTGAASATGTKDGFGKKVRNVCFPPAQFFFLSLFLF